MRCICPTKDCYEIIQTLDKVIVGSLLKVYGTCGDHHHQLIWQSQPNIANFAARNVLISSSIVCSGSSYSKVKAMFDLVNIPILSKTLFHKNLNKFIFPGIDFVWEMKKENLKAHLQSEPVYLVSDGQCDSPGFSAKYCIYTMMDINFEYIIDFEVVQVSQTTSLVAMEKVTFQTCLDRILDSNYEVKVLGTDQHPGIRKILKGRI